MNSDFNQFKTSALKFLKTGGKVLEKSANSLIEYIKERDEYNRTYFIPEMIENKKTEF